MQLEVLEQWEMDAGVVNAMPWSLPGSLEFPMFPVWLFVKLYNAGGLAKGIWVGYSYQSALQCSEDRKFVPSGHHAELELVRPSDPDALASVFQSFADWDPEQPTYIACCINEAATVIYLFGNRVSGYQWWSPGSPQPAWVKPGLGSRALVGADITVLRWPRNAGQ